MELKKKRRYRYIKAVGVLAVGLIGLIVIGVWLASVETHPAIRWVGRIVASITLVGLAWVIISVAYSYVKRTVLIVLCFAALYIYGLAVYQGMNQTCEGHENPPFATTILAPVNNTLSVFFPSRGAYSEEDHAEITASYQWLQLLSYFFFALLAFSLFGRKILNRSGYLLIRYNRKNIFWDYSENGKALVEDMDECTDDDQALFILSDNSPYAPEQDNRIFDLIDRMGAIAIYTDYAKANVARRCLAGYRHFFLTEDQDFNVRMALGVLEQLAKNLPTEKTHLYIRTETEYIDRFFEARLADAAVREMIEIHIYNQSALTARQFVAEYPVLDHRAVKVDTEQGRVSGRFHVLLLGLGWTGLELLRKTVGDAQFKGLDLAVTAIDQDYATSHGRYKYLFEEACKVFDIEINPLCGEGRLNDANSESFYDWLNEQGRIESFDRIIVALGDDQLNINTALQIDRFRVNYAQPEGGFEKVFVHVRDVDRYKYYLGAEASIIPFGGLKGTNSCAVLINQQMDRVAKMIHYVYSEYSVPLFTDDQFAAIVKSWTPIEEQWARASLFSQDSCRAVAMNIANMVRLAGGEQALCKRLKEPEYLERVAEMEHLRWNAFHLMSGIRTWRMDLANRPNGKLYVGTMLVRHICLVPYQELDRASETVNALRKPDAVREDYKESDRRIVRHFHLFIIYKNPSESK